MAKWLISQLNCFTEKPSLAPPPPPTELGAALLEEGDDRTSNAVISELAALPGVLDECVLRRRNATRGM